ncbi:recombinase family protein [Rhizobium leguminosarum]|uniref:recombinase family protein n=1 Tax=Rhizobium leguminosarum TaxID=384 RepID=UPI001C94354C|nr:recombinase family protein [Rhizobium leguminosarum]MBY5734048.1 recombinase family protein [Rhizobium leguminosarum]
MKTVLYARVSTVDQTAEHQLTQARQAGFTIDEVVIDQGVSGVNVPLAERAQGRRLFDMLRKGDVLVVRWVDRLGRNYADVTDAVRHFIRKGVIIKTVINNLTFDGATNEPMQMAIRDAMISFMAAAAQSQAEALKIAQRAGIEHAKAQNKPRTYKGRKPSFSRGEFDTVTRMLAEGAGASSISEATGLTRQTVLRIRADPTAANSALIAWGL